MLLACALTRPQRGRSVPFLQVADISVPSDEPMPLRSLHTGCVLEFPELAEDLYVESFHLRSDLTPASLNHRNVPFRKRRHNLLFVATLWLDGPLHAYCVVAFIPSSTIFSALSAASDKDRPSGRCLTWEEWGPSGTRMRFAPPCHSDIWVCYVSGLTYAVAHSSETNDYPPDTVRLYDFNQDALHYALSRDECIENTIVLEPTELPANSVFKQRIRTSLPYMIKAKRIPVDSAHVFSAVVLAEDAIVTVCNVSFRVQMRHSILTTSLRLPRRSHTTAYCPSSYPGLIGN